MPYFRLVLIGLAVGTLCAASCAATLLAQEPAAAPAATPAAKTPYAALGTPVNPKVSARWNRYHDYAEATELLKQLVAAHPKRARLASLGQSYGKREMWLLTLTNFELGPPEEKSAFWIDGGIHANEIQSVEVPLYTAWYLLEMYDQNTAVKKLLDERAFYLVPMMSPDSRDAHFYEPNTTHSPRTGLRPVDDDQDGLLDEDGPDDLDGDGHLTAMRVRDARGKYKPHAEYPELMIEVKPGEKGEYRLLGREGIDNDSDGKVNEDGDGSYDPNRNWPWLWQPEYVQNGAHRYPLSIGENRLVAEFQLSRPNIAGAQSYHNSGGMILRGPGAKSDSYENADLRIYETIGRKGEELLPGYKYMNVANDLYEVHGGEIDFLHQMCGVFTFTNELFTPLNYFHKPEHAQAGYFGSDDTQRLFDKYLLLGDGLVPWHEVEHPTYGKIEVGGMRKNWTRQPPAFLLEEECHRNMAFTLYHADSMPRVKIAAAAVKPLGENLFEITATIENKALIPTHSAADRKRKLTPPNVASLTGANLKVLAGLAASEPYFEKPREQKRDPARFELDPLEGYREQFVRWIVQGPGPYTIELISIKGGRDRREVP